MRLLYLSEPENIDEEDIDEMGGLTPGQMIVKQDDING